MEKKFIKKSGLFFLFALYTAFLYSCVPAQHKTAHIPQQNIPIVVPGPASELERFAADELSRCLKTIYPNADFSIQNNMPQDSCIVIGTKNRPVIRDYIAVNDLKITDSYVVTTAKVNHKNIGFIAGADPRGTLYGVYALLEELGYGFYLSYDAAPSPQNVKFDFAAWNLKDSPIFAERFVLNWHNFMSGCSSWDLDDWRKWITQLSKMRYNAIMVHAYGNNPIATFTHNGLQKPVGYLTTTQKGRDWGAQHVNDVRRIIGGKGVFDSPVYGSSAAQVPDEQRSSAAISLMQKTFSFAESRGMDVIYAIDVDTYSANPQNIINTLPDHARIKVKDAQVANPDAPEGYAYYKSRISALLNHYPQIDQIAIWFRRASMNNPWTIWRAIKQEDFPNDWKEQYQAILKEKPEVKDSMESASLFAIGKIAQAMRSILKEIGRDDVSLSAGSWGFDFLPDAHTFLPEEVKLLPLDYSVHLTNEDVTNQVAQTSRKRDVAPIVWAHHDDHTYIGRPYTPFANYASYMQQNKFTSLGIIHWTTRPLDLYFKNMAQQVWRRTKDEPVKETCLNMAESNFGPDYRINMGQYLNSWVTEGPMFGRETTDRFIDLPLKDAEAMIKGCRGRLALLQNVDPSLMNDKAKERFQYYIMLEKFCIRFYESQTALDSCKQYAKKFQIAQMYNALERCDPEAVIKDYARLSSLGGISTGEKGVLVSLNLRWMPYFMAQRQALQLEPIRINYQPTQHDPLAQASGHHTFMVDKNSDWWVGLGKKETGLQTFQTDNQITGLNASTREICSTGIICNKTARLQPTPFQAEYLPAGKYNLNLLFADPKFTQSGQRVFDLRIMTTPRDKRSPIPLVKERIDIVQRAGKGNQALILSYPIEISDGELDIILTPIVDKAMLCGVVIEPVQLKNRWQ